MKFSVWLQTVVSVKQTTVSRLFKDLWCHLLWQWLEKGHHEPVLGICSYCKVYFFE